MKRIAVLLILAVLGLAAIAAADVCAPAKVTDLTAPASGRTTVVLTFTDPGDDCNTGTAASWEVRRSSSTITEANYYSATLAATGTPAGGNGTTDCASISGLTCNTAYYFAVTFTDAAGNRSPVSNSVMKLTGSCNSNEVACE